jgi:hypothetical protein
VADTKIEKKHVVFSERVFDSYREMFLRVLEVRFGSRSESENFGPDEL